MQALGRVVPVGSETGAAVGLKRPINIPASRTSPSGTAASPNFSNPKTESATRLGAQSEQIWRGGVGDFCS